MKKSLLFFVICSIFICQSWANKIFFRTNQLGYFENDLKVAVAMIPKEIVNIDKEEFSLINISNGKHSLATSNIF